MNREVIYKPIFAFIRDGVYEVQVFGNYGLRVGQDLFNSSSSEMYLLSRSLLKPWQLLTCMPYLNDDDNWAIGMSSSSGEQIHTNSIDELLQSTSIDIESLVCPSSYSYDEKTRSKQVLFETKKSKKFHFCCGKHIAMKYAFQQMSRSSSEYHIQNNLLHLNLSRTMSLYTPKPIRWGTDSCGLPTLIAPIRSYLEMWGDLSSTDNKHMERVKKLWTENPVLIGGTTRIDTSLMKLSSGRIFAKEGADGLLAIHYLGSSRDQDVSIIIKLSQSVSDNYLIYALCCILKHHSCQLPSNFLELLEPIVNLEKINRKLEPNVKIINLLSTGEH